MADLANFCSFFFVQFLLDAFYAFLDVRKHAIGRLNSARLDMFIRSFVPINLMGFF